MSFFINAGVNVDVVQVAFESLAYLALPISSFVADKFDSEVVQGSVLLGGCECVRPSLKMSCDNGVIESSNAAAPVISAFAKDALVVDVQVHFHKVVPLVSLDKLAQGEAVVTDQPMIAARHRFFVSRDGLYTDACVIDQQLDQLQMDLPEIKLSP